MREGKGFQKSPRCFKHQEFSKAGKILLLLTMEFNEGESFIKRASSTGEGKIRKDCEDRVGWGGKGSRHSDFIQLIILAWPAPQIRQHLNNRHFNSVWHQSLLVWARSLSGCLVEVIPVRLGWQRYKDGDGKSAMAEKVKVQGRRW